MPLEPGQLQPARKHRGVRVKAAEGDFWTHTDFPPQPRACPRFAGRAAGAGHSSSGRARASTLPAQLPSTESQYGALEPSRSSHGGFLESCSFPGCSSDHPNATFGKHLVLFRETSAWAGRGRKERSLGAAPALALLPGRGLQHVGDQLIIPFPSGSQLHFIQVTLIHKKKKSTKIKIF